MTVGKTVWEIAEFVMDSYNIILNKEKVPTMKAGFDQLCSAIEGHLQHPQD